MNVNAVNVAVNNEIFEIQGFDELNKKLKQLPDRVKRQEVLKIFRRLAKPVIESYRRNLPKGEKPHTRYTRGGKTTYPPGNLAASVNAQAVALKYSDGNPSIAIRPAKRGKADGYYRFMVVRKGFKGSGRGSRKGANDVVPKARNITLAQTGAKSTAEAREKTAAYIQKQIDKLSNI